MRQKKLKVKEHDRYADKSLVVCWSMMVQESCDASWLFSEVFTDEVKEEFIRRGWNITTLRFSIAVNENLIKIRLSLYFYFDPSLHLLECRLPLPLFLIRTS